MKDILSIITAYRDERGWTEYQLAERSGLRNPRSPHGIARTWFRPFHPWRKSAQPLTLRYLNYLPKKMHLFP